MVHYIPEVGVRKTVTELLTRYAELTLSIYPTNPPPLVPPFSTKGHGLKICQKNRIGGDGQIYEMIILTFQSSRVSTYKYLMSLYFFTFSPFFYHLENVVSRNDLDCTLQHLPNLQSMIQIICQLSQALTLSKSNLTQNIVKGTEFLQQTLIF